MHQATIDTIKDVINKSGLPEYVKPDAISCLGWNEARIKERLEATTHSAPECNWADNIAELVMVTVQSALVFHQVSPEVGRNLYRDIYVATGGANEPEYEGIQQDGGQALQQP
ncbi:MAG: hypothetical protein KJ709_02990 [Nanoarchaeota archaeon]|nr:hypothetical protein [Nanoarchaeota archaeon]